MAGEPEPEDSPRGAGPQESPWGVEDSVCWGVGLLNVGMRDEPLDRRPISGLTISRCGPCSTPPAIKRPPLPPPLAGARAAPPPEEDEGGIGMALLRSSSSV